MSQVAIRRRIQSTSALAAFIGRNGDLSVDITKFTIVVHDGTTAGGIPLARADHTHADATTSVDGFLSAADKTKLNGLGPVATEVTDGLMAAADKLKLDGIPPGGGGGGPAGQSASVASTLVLRDTNADFAAHFITAAKFIGPLNGNADTVTNGVVTSGSYADPAWITSLSGAKLTGAGSVPSGVVTWANLGGKPVNVSFWTNDAGYITSSGICAGITGATSAPTASTYMVRDGFGRVQVASPSAAADVATKAYVDANVGTSSYTPTTPLYFEFFLNSPGTYTLINVNEAGLVHGMHFLFSTYTDLSKVTIQYTIDGNTPSNLTAIQFREMFAGNYAFPQSTFASSGFDLNGNQPTTFIPMDFGYKTSLKILVILGNPVVTFGSFRNVVGVSRFIKNP